MSRWIRRLASLALFAAIAAASAARAVDEVNVSTGATRAGPGRAGHGYDVVACFTQGSPDRYAVAHAGARYCFATQANLDADIQQKWSEDVSGNIAKADQNWRRIAHRAVGDL